MEAQGKNLRSTERVTPNSVAPAKNETRSDFPQRCGCGTVGPRTRQAWSIVTAYRSESWFGFTFGNKKSVFVTYLTKKYESYSFREGRKASF